MAKYKNYLNDRTLKAYSVLVGVSTYSEIIPYTYEDENNKQENKLDIVRGYGKFNNGTGDEVEVTGDSRTEFFELTDQELIKYDKDADKYYIDPASTPPRLETTLSGANAFSLLDIPQTAYNATNCSDLQKWGKIGWENNQQVYGIALLRPRGSKGFFGEIVLVNNILKYDDSNNTHRNIIQVTRGVSYVPKYLSLSKTQSKHTWYNAINTPSNPNSRTPNFPQVYSEDDFILYEQLYAYYMKSGNSFTPYTLNADTNTPYVWPTYQYQHVRTSGHQCGTTVYSGGSETWVPTNCYFGYEIILLGLVQRPMSQYIFETSKESTLNISAGVYEVQGNAGFYSRSYTEPEKIEFTTSLAVYPTPEIRKTLFKNTRMFSDSNAKIYAPDASTLSILNDKQSRASVIGHTEAGEPTQGLPIYIIPKEAVTKEPVTLNIPLFLNDGVNRNIIYEEKQVLDARNSIVLLNAAPNLQFERTFGGGTQVEAKFNFIGLDFVQIGAGWDNITSPMLPIMPLT